MKNNITGPNKEREESGSRRWACKCFSVSGSFPLLRVLLCKGKGLLDLDPLRYDG